MRDILGGIQYLPCPPPPAPLAARSAWTSTTNGTFHVEIPHPNVTLGLGSLWLLLAFLSIYTAVNYQSVVILNRRNAHPSLGNAWWAAYFALMSSSFLLDFLRYAMDLPESSTPSSSLSGNNFLLAACAIRRVSVAVLAASLSYHLQHRVQQDDPPEGESLGEEEASPLLSETCISIHADDEDDDSSLGQKQSALGHEIYVILERHLIEMTILAPLLLFLLLHAYNGFLVQWTFPIFIILSVSQCCPVVWRAWQCISKANAEPPRQEEFSSRGPSSYANLILGIGLTLSMFAWLLEPSQRNYLVVWLVQIMGKTENPAELCIVPPQWSTEGNSGERYGWASLMDVLEWTGGLGSIVLFYFIKLEFDRNSSFWVFLTVREVQSAFDFRS